MAKRKKSHKPRRRHGRRMGAASSAMNSALGIIAGAAAAKLVQNFLPIQNDKLKAAAPLAIGLFLPRFAKGKFASDAATGMIAVGGLSLAQSFNVPMLSGIGNYPALPAPMVSGMLSDSAPAFVAGVPTASEAMARTAVATMA